MGIFLWIAGVFLYMGLRNMRAFSFLTAVKQKRDVRVYYQLGVLTALSAQLAHNFVCVSLRFVSSGIFLWLLIGMIGALGIHNPMAEEVSEEAIAEALP